MKLIIRYKSGNKLVTPDVVNTCESNRVKIDKIQQN